MSARSRPPTDDTKTAIFDGKPAKPRAAGTTKPPPIPKAAVPRPPVLPQPRDASMEIQVISMKTPAEIAAERKGPARPEVPKVQLRSMGQVVRDRAHTPAQGFGNLAPPRDAKEARGRRWWSNTFWGAIAVIIASLVALVIWLVAGRR